MIVIADTNEEATSPKTIKALRKIFPKLQVESLAFGDLNVILEKGNMLAIERKRVDDFLASIADGRLFRQVENMSNGAKWSAVVVEGVFEYDEDDMVVIDGRATNWRGVSVRGALMAVQWSGCPVIFTASERSYPYIVIDIINFVSKPETHWQSLNRKRVVTFPPVSLTEEIISGLPGIGMKKSRALVNFASDLTGQEKSLARSLCVASVLHKVNYKSRPEGWGDTIITNVRAALGLADNEILVVKEEGKEKKNVIKRNTRKT